MNALQVTLTDTDGVTYTRTYVQPDNDPNQLRFAAYALGNMLFTTSIGRDVPMASWTVEPVCGATFGDAHTCGLTPDHDSPHATYSATR